MASLSLKNIYKKYPGGVVAVSDFNLEIKDKEFIIMVGPSGCGKSTTLRMIAGLEEISSGELYIGDRLVNDVAPKDRDIAMVFQNYALYPHMTVFDNMAFGLKLRKTPKDEIKRRVEEAARILDIAHLLDRKPKALSGGQRQRVALGRAIVREPKVFLLDEPLSNLDAKLRAQMRTELSKLHQKLGTTFIYVTHDQTEAMTMADRIVVMKDGLIQQVLDIQDASGLLNAALDLVLGDLTQLQTESHVIKHGHVGIQSVVLEHHGDIAILGSHVVDQTVTDVQLTGGNLLQTGDHTQSGGLTAAGRTDHDNELLVLDLQVEIRDGNHAAGILFVDVLQRKTCHNT